MAVRSFLKIDGIPGESADKKHKDEIDVISFSWGLTQAGSGPGRGGGAGKPSFEDFHFHFVARASKASPKLFLACASGQHITSALLTCRRGGKTPFEFLRIKLSDVLVSSYRIEGSAPSEPLDQVSLGFAKFEMHYVPAGKAGKLGPAVKAGWDVKANKKV